MTMQTAINAGTTRRLSTKRASITDDLVADYLSMVVNAGDKTLQIGGSDLGTVFLQRGAYHEVIAPLAALEGFQEACERRSVRADRLRGRPSQSADVSKALLDAALIGTDLGFPSMAGNWRSIANRLKLGGVLVLMGTRQGSPARLADALMADASWTLQDMIGGDVAVFRKTAAVTDADIQTRLSQVGDPRRAPRGLKPGLVSGLMRTLFGSRNINRTRALASRAH